MDRNPLRRALLGEFDLIIDEKNRLLIPAEIRKRMQSEGDMNALILKRGLNKRLWLYPERVYEEMATQAAPEIAPGQDEVDFAHVNYAMTDCLEWDSQGRIVLPEKALRPAQLNREVTLIGAKDHLEIWNRPDWAERRERLSERYEEISLRSRQTRQPPKDQAPY